MVERPTLLLQEKYNPFPDELHSHNDLKVMSWLANFLYISNLVARLAVVFNSIFSNLEPTAVKSSVVF